MTDIKPVPAATAVIVRESTDKADLEVLLLKRNANLVFHGGHWVFPGGRIDASDFTLDGQGLEYRAAMRAAVRETKEEAGLDIDIDQLIHIAHWTTPPKRPRRFCTWFFLCPLKLPSSVVVDNDEILEHRWVTPREALADAAAGNWVLPRPTKATLEDMEMHRNLEELLKDVSQRGIRVFPEGSSYYRPQEAGC